MNSPSGSPRSVRGVGEHQPWPVGCGVCLHRFEKLPRAVRDRGGQLRVRRRKAGLLAVWTPHFFAGTRLFVTERGAATRAEEPHAVSLES
jgi:hypothetical protein